jgi:hypothetical protein
MLESLYTDFGKLVAILGANCGNPLHEYPVLDPPVDVDCWHTQHVFDFSHK